MSIQAVARNQHLLAGTGIDWGTGVGCLAIVAARILAVRRVVGLDVVAANVAIARRNADLNGVAQTVGYEIADSYTPASVTGRRRLDELRHATDFILANPPASDGDDGLGFRRKVLAGASQFLVTGGKVVLAVSYQYGRDRIERLSDAVPGFSYGGILASSAWVPFDLARPDLLECLELYAREERRGGPAYSFSDTTDAQFGDIDARRALRRFRGTGESPLSKWQVHLFERSSAG